MGECINCGNSPASHRCDDTPNWNFGEYLGKFMCDECHSEEVGVERLRNYYRSLQYNDTDYIQDIQALKADLAKSEAERVRLLENDTKLHNLVAKFGEENIKLREALEEDIKEWKYELHLCVNHYTMRQDVFYKKHIDKLKKALKETNKEREIQ